MAKTEVQETLDEVLKKLEAAEREYTEKLKTVDISSWVEKSEKKEENTPKN